MRERGKEREKEREREPTLKKEEEKDRSESANDSSSKNESSDAPSVLLSPSASQSTLNRIAAPSATRDVPILDPITDNTQQTANAQGNQPMRSISPSPATAPHRSTSIPPSFFPPQFPVSISPSSQVSLASNSAIFAQNCMQLSFPSSSLTPFASLSPFSSSSIAPQIFDKALSGATSSISPSSSSSSSNHHLPQQRQQQHLQQTAVFQSLPSDFQPDLSAEKSSEFD
ncbi:uncharacterized protein MONOS_4075 [Monocercomonoides exilis]|uniref:uncharacterized protein n=1 Tax=Monocercomonoides exilis TaxID=2049356 RepID=UPI00355AAA92|nr:hypothetical protein MONOS_4075 [Monocercomonoides exilis]|eukprot:MONOS_4075.1-p1 / transcript=MONOS_4075.1 / gene=MONOS_4075 / organism=Monocercomonoides_exilis_PA203 / gene_product=unspecified product / transcript_product=unspecified product / location=Mono_scaffold00103:122094-122777(-) / protein_length=228 / sequence_SO=supercontig / SO=protein_coding / is_pseudo=false